MEVDLEKFKQARTIKGNIDAATDLFRTLFGFTPELIVIGRVVESALKLEMKLMIPKKKVASELLTLCGIKVLVSKAVVGAKFYLF